MVVELIILGNIPSKKNQRRLMVRGGRMINIPSKNYMQWHEEAWWQIKKRKIQPMEGRLSIEVKIWYKDNRRKDADNAYTSISDLLCDAGVIPDDNWQTLSDIHIVSMGVDKENPRAEIKIKNC